MTSGQHRDTSRVGGQGAPPLIPGSRCWLDATDLTALWQCTLCWQADLSLTRDEAERRAVAHHRRAHPDVQGAGVVQARVRPQCSVVACWFDARRNGMCEAHATRVRRGVTGEALATAIRHAVTPTPEEAHA